MEDHEIATKKLSDWKPETDIKLQKAFGKFVEEAGELLEVIPDYTEKGVCSKVDFENELADILAFIYVIEKVAGKFTITDKYYSEDLGNNYLLNVLTKRLGIALNIVGRCQIQGLNGKHPDSGVPNWIRLEVALLQLSAIIAYVVKRYHLDQERVLTRMQAKVDSKLPWVMGTATDLLPST